MNNLAQIKERYLRDSVSIRLGGLAANLARVKSFSKNDQNQDAVFNLFEESKFFIEWTASETKLETTVELIEFSYKSRFGKDSGKGSGAMKKREILLLKL